MSGAWDGYKWPAAGGKRHSHETSPHMFASRVAGDSARRDLRSFLQRREREGGEGRVGSKSYEDQTTRFKRAPHGKKVFFPPEKGTDSKRKHVLPSNIGGKDITCSFHRRPAPVSEGLQMHSLLTSKANLIRRPSSFLLSALQKKGNYIFPGPVPEGEE